MIERADIRESSDGEMAALVTATDWAATPIGPPSSWSQALRTVVGLVLQNRFPMLLWWGPSFVQLYNDAYAPILGVKHPAQALGKPVAECWSEIIDIIGPMIEQPFRGGPSAVSDDLALMVRRRGFVEETHFKVAYSPVPDESVPSGVGGVLATVAEITEEVYGRRQLATLGELASNAADAETSQDACTRAARTLEGNALDVPCALFYLLDDTHAHLDLVAAAGFDGADPTPKRLALDDRCPWPVGRVIRERHPIPVEVGPFPLPAGAWTQRPERALVLPLASPERPQVYGILVVGLSPHRELNAPYTTFLGLAAGHVASAIRTALAYQHERERAEKLAEIDRTKTVFFSNVSHELRTPLTLILGPLADALRLGRPLDGEDLKTTHRSTLRLLKLVNSLLDFARIEAGRIDASYVSTDLASATRDLASVFRSAFERAGLVLDVSGIEDLDGPVLVDRAMWEKIVLNLLSNALKFTFEGTISVGLRATEDGFVVLEVADTGVGIPQHEMPRLFERFHRVRNVKSRAHEGTGIGLALVLELARLHGGTVEATSEEGKGTRFVVRIRRRPAETPPEPIGSIGALPFVEEAMRWLPSEEWPSDRWPLSAGPGAPRAEPTAHVLIADDNADMRDYIARLLSPRYSVKAVADGAMALRAVAEQLPDLVVADVMMPNLDGFGLVQALRGGPATSDVPIILLSARAGEEATTEGLQTGADDYVVKPFASRELVARVDGLVKLGRARRDVCAALESERRARAEAETANRAKDEFLAMLGHELRNPLAPIVTALRIARERDPSFQKELIVIERQVAHLRQLVDDLLDVARIAHGKIDLKREVVDIDSMIASALELASPILEERAHHLELDLAPGLEVTGDRHRLAQVVTNLVVNAAKYTDRGGHIRVSARAEPDFILLRVEDDGIGMTREVLARVFDTFAQSRQSIDRSHGGLGLGLAIVKGIVDAHGGTVSASSDGPGCGSVLEVRLPRKTATASSAAPRPTEPRDSGRPPRRVLVVDDNADAADMVAEWLRRHGDDARVAYDGLSALAVAREFHPEVGFIDLGLPVMDGFELVGRIRAEPELAAMHLVAVTGYGQAADRSKSASAGFDAHLVKPVDIADLQSVLDHLPAPPA